MRHVQGKDRNQITLFPQTLEDRIEDDNPVRFIDEFVNQIDLKELGFTHAQTKDVGRKPFDPSDMLKLYIYGYVIGVRSSRKLETEAKRNIEVIWLLSELVPDYRTIASFRKENKEGIRNVFKLFVVFCKEINLLGKNLVAIDGSKFKAVNSRKRNYNKKSIKTLLENIDKAIDKYLTELEENDNKEKSTYATTERELKRKINKLKGKKEELKQLQQQIIETNQTQISLTDPDSRLMKNNGKLDVCYNGQSVVDDKHYLIVDVEVTNDTDDHHQLNNMSSRAKEILGVEELEALLDKGYFNRQEIKECIENGIVPYIPKPEDREYKDGVPSPKYSLSKFKYLEEKDVYLCPCGKELKYIRTVNIRGITYKTYETPDCKDCKSKKQCTKSKKGRLIYRWEDEKLIDDMQERMKGNKLKYKKRQAMVEHPFGTIKRTMNQGYMLTKGIDNVRTELNLSALAYNIKRVMNIIGVKKLIEALMRLFFTFFKLCYRCSFRIFRIFTL